MKKKSKWLRFLLGMVIYALVVVLIASVGLKFLWDFADEYEKELPARKMNEYVASLSEKRVKKLSIDFVSSLDHNIQSDADAYAEVWRCFVGGVRYQRLSSDSEKEIVTYLIYNNEHTLGEVTLVKNGDGLGDKTWSVAREDYDFSFLLRSESFIVPDHWVVRCGERRLGVQYIVNPRVEYSFLGDFYGQSFPMPYLAEYEISNYVGDPKIRFFDADGEEHPRFTFTDGRDQMKRASGTATSAIDAFTRNFVPLYVNCLSNVSKSAGMNYQRIKPYLVPGSELDVRLQAAMGGQVFAQSRGTEISDVTIHEIFNLENEYYIADLSYTVVTYSDKGSSTVDTDMYLVLYRDEDVYKAQMVVLY
jgi:hypothetical protein